MVCEKKLIDEVACWLKVFDDGSVDRTWNGRPEAEFIAKPVHPHEHFIDGVAVLDVKISTETNLSLRIYKPERNLDDEKKIPVILHFHGGGFCISEPEWYFYYQFYTRIVRTARSICVSVKMRRAPEHRLPAAIDDCFSALLWLRDVARGKVSSDQPWLEVEADFKRVFLMGDSSGGNLVHEVAARTGTEELDPMRLAGGIPIHPGFVRAERSRSELENKSDSAFLTLEMVDKLLAYALPLGSTKDHPITCPMGPEAPPLAGLNLPPFLLVVAENDLIRDTQLEYYQAMKKAGKDIELMMNPGMAHCFYLNKIATDMDPRTALQTDRLLQTITDFIKRH
ncbi:PREDICTED: probable carboxylesterase 15 [Nelumbo nucifera]|uniref:Probable carboxylesterase 15 n=1 Tax=Nelumbo nucifera TaxID=4432 RepID=A0A1U7YWY5_NELNU|nr:PREDICTED: probable carboxylesterase 15 [Nelumbo nucifera]